MINVRLISKIVLEMKFLKRISVVVLSGFLLMLMMSPAKNKNDVMSIADDVLSSSHEEQVPIDNPAKVITNQGAQNSKAPVNVFLFTYMRGGSSLLGEVFNQNPDVFYWYEPLTQFYSHVYGVAPTTRYTSLVYDSGRPSKQFRKMSAWELDKMVEYMRDMFSCNLARLPPETLGNLRFMRHPKAASAFYECYLHHASSVPRPGLRASDIKDFSFPEFLWDLNCKNESRVLAHCSASAGVNYGCRTVLESFRALDRSEKSVSEIRRLFQQASFASQNVDSLIKDFQEHHSCQQRVADIINNCINQTNIESSCSAKPIRVAKCIRVKMTNFQPLLAQVPNLKVIHYVRDPRAVSYSFIKKQKKPATRSSFTSIADAICREMFRDITVRMELEKKYPGVFLVVKYENLVTDTDNAVKKLYAHIGFTSIAPEVTTYLQSAFHGSGNDGKFGTQRLNASDLVDSWRREVAPALLEEVAENHLCMEVLSNLNYDL